jgi:hypothetical protein
VILVVQTLLHEFSYGIAASKVGLTAKIHFSLYLGFMSIFYLHIPSLYLLKRIQRIAVFLADIS